MYDSIVITVDRSEETKHAASRGIVIGRAFGATVYVLHRVEQQALRLTETDDEEIQLQNLGKAILEEIEGLAPEFDHSVTTELIEGKPPVQISEDADEQDADRSLSRDRG